MDQRRRKRDTSETAFELVRDVHIRVRGRHRRGKLVIGAPKRKPHNGKLAPTWACSYAITGIDDVGTEICGEDPLDALVNCLRFVRKLIEKHKSIGYEVWWLEEGDNGCLALR